MRSDNEPEPDRGARSFLWPIVIVAIVLMFVALHLTGVVGPAH
jgi:hypothetical protein